eukprot:9897140-Ditylum_brightwellii.AAC.1
MPPPKDKFPNYKGKSEYKVRSGKKQTCPPKWLDLGFCPMHARLLHMFSNFKDDHYTANMDNLFNFVMLCVEALHFCPRKVFTQGVIRQSGRGVHPCVLQQELSGKGAEQSHGIVKAAVPKGDSHASNINIASGYDQKPFYMISSTASE